MRNVLAYISIGDREREIERLIGALVEVRRKLRQGQRRYVYAGIYRAEGRDFAAERILCGKGIASARRETKGRICSEFVMCYPPGIPILAPGEQITEEILEYILYAKEKGCSMTGPEDPGIERLNVLKGGMGLMELMVFGTAYAECKAVDQGR